MIYFFLCLLAPLSIKMRRKLPLTWGIPQNGFLGNAHMMEILPIWARGHGEYLPLGDFVLGLPACFCNCMTGESAVPPSAAVALHL